jgi:hypothetical protein
MAYKLIDAAQTRWRAVNAPPLVALVRAGAVVHKGKLLERSADITPTETGPGSTETEVALKALAQVGHYPVLVLLVRCGAVCGVP